MPRTTPREDLIVSVANLVLDNPEIGRRLRAFAEGIPDSEGAAAFMQAVDRQAERAATLDGEPGPAPDPLPRPTSRGLLEAEGRQRIERYLADGDAARLAVELDSHKSADERVNSFSFPAGRSVEDGLALLEDVAADNPDIERSQAQWVSDPAQPASLAEVVDRSPLGDTLAPVMLTEGYLGNSPLARKHLEGVLAEGGMYGSDQSVVIVNRLQDMRAGSDRLQQMTRDAADVIATATDAPAALRKLAEATEHDPSLALVLSVADNDVRPDLHVLENTWWDDSSFGGGANAAKVIDEASAVAAAEREHRAAVQQAADSMKAIIAEERRINPAFAQTVSERLVAKIAGRTPAAVRERTEFVPPDPSPPEMQTATAGERFRSPQDLSTSMTDDMADVRPGDDAARATGPQRPMPFNPTEYKPLSVDGPPGPDTLY